MPVIQRTNKKAFTNMLLKKIPVALRDHFKAWCALRGRSMKSYILEFMEEKIKERQEK